MPRTIIAEETILKRKSFYRNPFPQEKAKMLCKGRKKLSPRFLSEEEIFLYKLRTLYPKTEAFS